MTIVSRAAAHPQRAVSPTRPRDRSSYSFHARKFSLQINVDSRRFVSVRRRRRRHRGRAWSMLHYIPKPLFLLIVGIWGEDQDRRGCFLSSLRLFPLHLIEIQDDGAGEGGRGRRGSGVRWEEGEGGDRQPDLCYRVPPGSIFEWERGKEGEEGRR